MSFCPPICCQDRHERRQAAIFKRSHLSLDARMSFISATSVASCFIVLIFLSANLATSASEKARRENLYRKTPSSAAQLWRGPWFLRIEANSNSKKIYTDHFQSTMLGRLAPKPKYPWKQNCSNQPFYFAVSVSAVCWLKENEDPLGALAWYHILDTCSLSFQDHLRLKLWRCQQHVLTLASLRKAAAACRRSSSYATPSSTIPCLKRRHGFLQTTNRRVNSVRRWMLPSCFRPCKANRKHPMNTPLHTELKSEQTMKTYENIWRIVFRCLQLILLADLNAV